MRGRITDVYHVKILTINLLHSATLDCDIQAAIINSFTRSSRCTLKSVVIMLKIFNLSSIWITIMCEIYSLGENSRISSRENAFEMRKIDRI